MDKQEPARKRIREDDPHYQSQASPSQRLKETGNTDNTKNLNATISESLKELVPTKVCDFSYMEMPEKLKEYIYQNLDEILGNEQINPWVRCNIAEAVGKLGDTSIVAPLLDMLSNQQIESEIRCNIAEAVGNLGDTSAVTPLLDMLSNKYIHPDMHKSIAHACYRYYCNGFILEQMNDSSFD